MSFTVNGQPEPAPSPPPEPTDSTPVAKGAPPLTELGRTGLLQYAGRVTDDILAALHGARAIKTYREMAENDATVGAILFAIEMLLRKLDWEVKPYADKKNQEPESKEAIDAAKFCEQCMFDMSASWSDTISAVVSMLPYGWSFLEIVYKKRKGGKPDDTDFSQHDDNKIGWKKLALRSQDTLHKWEFDTNGGLNGMWQQIPFTGVGTDLQPVFIPITKALLFRTTAARGNPEGRSVLRNAYRSWYFLRRIQEIEAVGVERDLAGLPVAWVPPSMLADAATPQEKQALEAIKQLVRNIRRDEQEGLVFPLAYDPEGKGKAFDLTLLSTGGRRQFDTGTIIGRYQQEIAQTVLADFIMLGHGSTGSRSLGSSKIDLFEEALSAWSQTIADVFNQFGFPRLMAANGMDVKLCPTLVPGRVERRDLATVGAFLQQVAQAGAPLFPDETLEGWVREIAGMPPKEEGGGELPLDQAMATVAGAGGVALPPGSTRPGPQNPAGSTKPTQPATAPAPQKANPSAPAKPATAKRVTLGGPRADAAR